jgi:concentrative nucleoside transporter, CNT family
MTTLQCIAGLAVFVGLAWMLCENRQQVKITTIAVGMGVQLLLALEQATRAGTSMVFGYLGGRPFAL